MAESNNYLEMINDSIKDADKVLIGIGQEMSYDIGFGPGLDPKNNYLEGMFYKKKLDSDDDAFTKWDSAYSKLKTMLEGKDYYIMSLLMDDVIYRTFDQNDKIVTPLGGFRNLQCMCGCNGKVYPVNSGITECPDCKAPLIFNNLLAEKYVEEGYMSSFADYKKWLTTTINKKLCILELGAGMQFPGIVRMAFDKVAYYNQKCTFYRVHQSLYQHTADNSERGISVKKNAMELLG